MPKKKLTICIPTTIDRRRDFEALRWEFNRQRMKFGLAGETEIVFLEDSKEMTIGEKRQKLYQMAQGEYAVQWDSDDGIHPEGLKMIIEAIKNNPGVDCITYEEYVNIDGKEYKSNHSNIYDKWEGDGNTLLSDGFHFHRTVFFKNVIKTELAKSIPVVPCRFGEDNMYADALKPFIKSEKHIDEQIYRYIHISSNPTERYGLDK